MMEYLWHKSKWQNVFIWFYHSERGTIISPLHDLVVLIDGDIHDALSCLSRSLGKWYEG